MNTKELRDGYLALRDLFAKSGPTVKYEVLEEELASRLKMFRTRVKFEKAQEELGFDSRIFGDEPLTDKDRENIDYCYNSCSFFVHNFNTMGHKKI